MSIFWNPHPNQHEQTVRRSWKALSQRSILLTERDVHNAIMLHWQVFCFFFFFFFFSQTLQRWPRLSYFQGIQRTMWNGSYDDDAVESVVKKVLQEVQGSTLHMQLQKAAQVCFSSVNVWWLRAHVVLMATQKSFWSASHTTFTIWKESITSVWGSRWKQRWKRNKNTEMHCFGKVFKVVFVICIAPRKKQSFFASRREKEAVLSLNESLFPSIETSQGETRATVHVWWRLKLRKSHPTQREVLKTIWFCEPLQASSRTDKSWFRPWKSEYMYVQNLWKFNTGSIYHFLRRLCLWCQGCSKKMNAFGCQQAKKMDRRASQWIKSQ